MFISFFLFPLVSSVFSDWECGGDHSHFEEIPIHSRHLISRSSSPAPIRILYHYLNFDLATPEQTDNFKQRTIKSADSFFKTSLSVFPISSNLVLSSKSCLSEVQVPEEHRTLGVEADLVIYLTSSNLTSLSYVAKSGACERQVDGLNNVVAGTVVINVAKFNEGGFAAQLNVLTHEITHILGFSTSSFNYWKNSAGLPYQPNEVKRTVNVRGVNKTVLVTPTILAKAREAFDCETIEGIELEESGSSGAHWDRRIMMNEYMTSSVSPEPYWSSLSLALLQDSGWYHVNYSLSLPPIIGKTSKCQYFESNCVKNGTSSDPNIWCESKSSWTCDTLSLNKGYCKISTYASPLPPAFQYFQSNTTGGSEASADYCPYRARYSNGACRGNSLTTFTYSRANERIGATSRCFESTLVLSPYKLAPPYSACYEVVSCSEDSALVKIGEQSISCPFTGGEVTVPGYTGSIKCPSSDVLCSDVPCKNFCSAQGLCRRGVCECFAGFAGDDCSQSG